MSDLFLVEMLTRPNRFLKKHGLINLIFFIHFQIDHVINPSWQAQIKGVKRWFLQPPPECFYECRPISVDVQPGDISMLITLYSFILWTDVIF